MPLKIIVKFIIANIFFILISQAHAGTVLQPKLSGIWYNSKQDGHGLFINISKAKTTNNFIASWYTYDNGKPLWILGSGTYTEGSQSIELSAIITSGGNFGDRFVSGDVIRTHWGTLSFRFNSCNEGVLEYKPAISGFNSGSLPITRLTETESDHCSTDVDTTATETTLEPSGFIGRTNRRHRNFR